LKTITVKRFSLTLSLLLGVGFFTLLSAQTFDDAKNYAFNGQRSKARAICRAILAKGFDSDVATLMGRTYAWDKQYDSARVVLQNVIIQNPENSDALSALADVEYWNDRYPQALEYCNRILAKNPENETVQYQKARILNSAEQYQDAAGVLENLLRKNSANSDAMRLLDRVRLELIKNKITINYTYDYFNNAAYNKDPWQLIYLQYARKTSLGTLIGRVNYANRFATKAVQLEADAYPRIGENDYLYLNYGFSNVSIFPRQRGGFEWYHSFPNAFEGSLGGRILHFQNSKRVVIYTGSFGKYLGNYWFSLRPFVTPGSDGTSVSTYLIVRRYFSDPENYIGLRLGVGSSPDERRLLLFEGNQSAHLKSQSIKLDYNHIFSNRWILNTGVAFANEEYWIPKDDIIKIGNNLSFELAFAYLF
jgi:YaiO family outer membrane protein